MIERRARHSRPADRTDAAGNQPVNTTLPRSNAAVHAVSDDSTHWVWVWALFAVLWLIPIGQRPLISPDEGRYATLALHILQSGDWVTPRLNGFLYFEKPPLGYWAGALAFQLFGVNEFAARLWPAVAGLGCAAAVGWAAAAWWGREAAVRAVAIAASMLWIVGNGHFLTLDSGLSFGLTLALTGVLHGFAPGVTPQRHRVALLGVWVGMAVATLAKGPIGIVIPGATLLIYSGVAWLQGDRAALTRVWCGLEWGWGLALYLLLTAPWFVLVSMRNPGFAEFFFIHEHVLRYTTGVSRRTGAIWYFVPLLIMGSLPWATLMAQRAWQALRAPGAHAVGHDSPLRPTTLMWCWCGFVFVFFSLSGSKLPSYILPMFAPLAMLAAWPGELGSGALKAHLWAPPLPWLSLAAIWPLLPRMATQDAPLEALQQIVIHGAVGALLVVAGCGLAWMLCRRGRGNAAVVSLAVAHLVASLVLNGGYGGYAALKTAQGYAPLIASAIPADAPVFVIKTYDQSLPFYLRRGVILVDYVDEFAFGEQVEPGRMLPTVEAFAERWLSLPAAAAVMSPGNYDLLVAKGVPMKVLFRDVRRVVVTRHAP
jgi:4-amino-4-deoxy-L-arabinose transferase-like glycosyltransferase